LHKVVIHNSQSISIILWIALYHAQKYPHSLNQLLRQYKPTKHNCCSRGHSYALPQCSHELFNWCFINWCLFEML